MLRTVVTFTAEGFNTSEERANFLEAGNYGEDLANWLVQRLSDSGVSARPEVGQEDFGWCFTFESAGKKHDLLIAFRPQDPEDRDSSEGIWVAWIERSHGLFLSLLGRRNHGIVPSACESVHRVLASSSQIDHARWYHFESFDPSDEQRSAAVP